MSSIPGMASLCASLLLLAGCVTPRAVVIPAHAVRLTVENDWRAPFILDGVEPNLTAKEVVQFLLFFYQAQPGGQPHPDIIVTKVTALDMPGEVDVIRALKALSAKYGIVVYVMPLPSSERSGTARLLAEAWEHFRQTKSQ